MNANNKYSLETIAQRKAEVNANIEQSKNKIESLVHSITAPPKHKNNTELWMHYASNGMSTFKGIITVIKTYKRIRTTFQQKQKKKNSFFSWL